MDIKTKLNVGDKAYFMLQNEITQILITQVQVFVFGDNIAISYMGKITDDMEGNLKLKESIEERRLYRTIDDLVSSLKENVNKFYDDAKPEIH